MRHVSIRRTAAVLITLSLLATPLAFAGKKTIIILERSAKSDGMIALTLTPGGGDPKAIEVSVTAKMKVKDIVGDIRKEADLALGDGYKVKAEDRKIIIQPKKDNPEVKAVIGKQTVEGLSVTVK